jgi:hypothetical protein
MSGEDGKRVKAASCKHCIRGLIKCRLKFKQHDIHQIFSQPVNAVSSLFLLLDWSWTQNQNVCVDAARLRYLSADHVRFAACHVAHAAVNPPVFAVKLRNDSYSINVCIEAAHYLRVNLPSRGATSWFIKWPLCHDQYRQHYWLASNLRHWDLGRLFGESVSKRQESLHVSRFRFG